MYTSVGKKLGLDIMSSFRLAGELKKGMFDIIHIHNPGSLLYGVLGARLACKKNVLVTEHGYSDEPKKRHVRRDWILYRQTKKIVAVSEMLRKKLESTYKIESKLTTIKNGIGTKVEDFGMDEARNKFLMRSENYNIGIVARLVPIKNHILLLRAFRQAKRTVNRLKLWIVGGGPLEHELKEETRVLGLNEDVRFLGRLNNVHKFLCSIDLFVLCSKSEGLSITLLEAMRAGVPIIATNVGGNSEVIENGISGILLEKNDETELANAITRSYGNKKSIKSLGDNARIRFHENFSVDRMANDYISLYKDLQ
jgi:glycosyltransferase involved in cell wall biosynthesis